MNALMSWSFGGYDGEKQPQHGSGRHREQTSGIAFEPLSITSVRTTGSLTALLLYMPWNF